MACELIKAYDKSNRVITSGKKFNDINLMRNINHWWKYTSASFGWQYNLGYQYEKKMSGFFRGLFMNTNKINTEIICEKCDILNEDIIVASWHSQLMIPGYYLAVDHKKKAIVITVRGSFAIKDAIPDLIATKVNFLGGEVHEGILIATKKIKKKLDPYFIDLEQKYPDYQIICTGHSLGGGCAAIYTMLLLEDNKELNVHAYCYGCPSLVNLELAEKYRDHITTIINNFDIIPRMSYGSMEDLKFKILKVLDQSNGFLGRVFQTLQIGNTLGSAMNKKLEKFLETSSIPNITPINTNLIFHLWPPGSIINMIKTSDNNLYIEKSHPSLFTNIIISENMLMDHFPDQYDKTLNMAEKIMIEIDEK